MFREGSVHYCHPVQGIPQSGHPVIIIKLLGGAAVLGTVTSHGAGKFKGTEKAIPWIRNRTHARRIHHFRAFNGSAKPNWRPLLELEPGQRWPMPEASWIEVDRVFEAPLSTLGRFTKSPYALQMTTASLDDLRAHIAECPGLLRSGSLRRWGLAPQSTWTSSSRNSSSTSLSSSSSGTSLVSTPMSSPPSTPPRKPTPRGKQPVIPPRTSSAPTARSWARVVSTTT